MALVYPVIFGGSQADWVRPFDWIKIPAIASGSEVIYALCMINDDYNNFLAFVATGNYTVDWGDGTVENVASGVKAEHEYSYAAISATTLTTEAFKQVLVKITPQAGENLTAINFANFHSSYVIGKSSIIIELTMSIPNVAGANLGLGNATSRFTYLRHLNIISVGTLTAISFYWMMSLEKLVPFDTSAVTLMNNGQFQYFRYKHLAGFNFAAVTDWYMAFRYSRVESIDLTITAATNFYYNFVSTENYNIRSIILRNCYNITQIQYSFENCTFLKKILLYRIKRSFTVRSCSLTSDALNALFNSVEDLTGLTAQSIVITGNPGAASCDTSIATAKNWNVVTT